LASRLPRFFAELKRRKVYHVAVVYIAVGWAVITAAQFLLEETLGQPRELWLVLAGLIVLGFPMALILAWAYEIRPEDPAPVEGKAGEAEPQREPLRTSDFTTDASVPDGELKPSIAVLPFDDFSPDPADAYFANGMHEEVITQLQKIQGLSVRGRTSVGVYRDAPQPLPEIAARLGVGYILEGSARKAGDQVRLTAQLIDARKDEHLWAENYDRPLSVESLFSVQSDIAQQVASELRAVLTPEELRQVERRSTENLHAYEHFLRGRHLAHKYTQAGWTAGIEHFQKAMELDPEFAQAYVGLAYCFKELAHLERIPPEEGYGRAAEALATAIELDDRLGEAHSILGSVKAIKDWDMEGAEPHFKRGLELDPQSAETHNQYAQYLSWNGRFDEGIELIDRALALEPLDPFLNMFGGVMCFYARRHDESIARMKGLLELDPDHIWAHMYLTHNYALLGEVQEGLVHADRVETISQSTGDRTFLAYLGSDYPGLGKPERTREILAITLELYEEKTIDAVTVAVLFGVLGQHDEALSWLERAVEERSGIAVYIKNYGGTFLEGLSSDPRFERILERVGFRS
jgi:TolB-like protein/Tfp pilus assembly protein PilF